MKLNGSNILKVIEYPKRSAWDQLLRRPAIESGALGKAVRAIVLDVKENGDAALRKYSAKFDRFAGEFAVDPSAFLYAEAEVSSELKKAILQAAKNIEKFHASQLRKFETIETMPGVKCWKNAVGIEKVGLYVPGGSAPLFSTVLMLAIPAKLAGCRQIVLCTPADKNGVVAPEILFAAKCCGVNEVFRIGGAQAIAAMAFGTETVPEVSKIFGPGNQYVTCAKQLVNSFGVAIDMPAGPSELAILADLSCVPEFVAADLLSQAEHGPDSQVVLVSENRTVIREVNRALKEQIRVLPRRIIAAEAMKNSRAILVESIAEGLDLLNDYAPEHLIIACRNEEKWGRKVINAGSVFLGNYSCESAGDYASGTNHTLPTNGYAKAYSGVSVDSFMRQITFQKLSRTGLRNIAGTIELMASAEGLEAHRNAVAIRKKK